MANEIDQLRNSRRLMAETLLKRAGTPTTSLPGALLNGLAAGIGGYFEGQTDRQAGQHAADESTLFNQPSAPVGGPPTAPPPSSAPPMASNPVLTPELLQAHAAAFPPNGAPAPTPSFDAAASQGAPGKGDKLPIAGAPSFLDRLSVTPTPKSLAMALQPEDRDRVIRTIIGEADKEPPEGKQAVADVILNRAKLSGQAPGAVVTAPGQFEPWMTAAGRARMTAPTPDSPSYQSAAQALEAAQAGDITGGATHFYSPGAQAALGRQPPSWAAGQPGQTIGSQNFYKLPYGGQPSTALAFNGSPQPQAGFPAQPPAAATADAFNPQTYAPSQPPVRPLTPADRPQLAPVGQPQQSAAPQAQIGGYTPQVLQTLQEWAKNGNPAQMARATELLNQYTQLRAMPQQSIHFQQGPLGEVPVLVDNTKGTVTAIPGGVKGMPASNSLGDPTKTGEEFLQTLPSGFAGTVKGIGDGRIPFPSSFTLKTPYGQALMDALSHYRPDMTAQDYATRLATEKAFDVGSEGKAVRSANQAILHAQTLSKTIDKLPNVNFLPALANPAIEAYKSQTDPAYQNTLSNFRNDVNALAGELTKAFRGNSGAIQDIEHWRQSMSETGSIPSLRGGVQSAMELLNGAIESLGDQYNKGTKSNREPRELLSERNRAAFDQLRSNGNVGEKAPNASPQPSGEIRYLNGKAYRRGPNGEAIPVQ